MNFSITGFELVLRRSFGDQAREAFLAANPPPWDDITEACYHVPFSDKLDEHLDAAHGSYALRDPRLAPIVADRLHHFDGQRYGLWSDVIMPNHVHALFTLRDGESLPDTLQGWKGVSSRLFHQTGLSALNPIWQPDDFARLIRSPELFSTVKAFLAANPQPWDDLTEACHHIPFFDNLDEHLDNMMDAAQRVPATSGSGRRRIVTMPFHGTLEGGGQRLGVCGGIHTGELLQQFHVHEVFLAVGGFLAGNDVAQMGHGEDVFHDATRFRGSEGLDAVRSVDDVHIERTVFDLHEILAGEQGLLGVCVDLEVEITQGGNASAGIFNVLGSEEVEIERGAGIAKEDRACFAEKKIVSPMLCQRFRKLPGLGEFKLGSPFKLVHSRGKRADAAHTKRDTRSLWQRNDWHGPGHEHARSHTSSERSAGAASDVGIARARVGEFRHSSAAWGDLNTADKTGKHGLIPLLHLPPRRFAAA
ncbi:MAG TPA: hypothetical protein DIT64_15755 [Verrucomicrobiales bacterium]|nr:hypothetical protein [Verrucomicrobiales bacterium]